MVTVAWAAPRSDSFTVTAGDAQVNGKENSSDYTTEYIIDADEGEDPVAVSVSGKTENGRIIVNTDATITLDDVTMELDDCNGSPIEIADGVNATLILDGKNTLTAYAAGPGILVKSGAT